MSQSEPPTPARFLTPRYWPTWAGLGLLRLSVLLPFPVMLWSGRQLGKLLYILIGSRRHVALTNLRLCFPDLSQKERQKLARESFISAAISLFEGVLSWWGRDSRLKKLYRIEGLEHLESARRAGNGVILLGGHYTTLEISGRFLAYHVEGLQPIYKPAKNPLFELVMANARKRLFDDLVPSRDMRRIVRNLKRNKVIWYAPDQDFGRKQSVFAPFFGVPTATLTTTARLARLSGAPVVPYYSERLPGKEGYRVKLLPALEGFPCGDDLVDATRTNQVLERQVERMPEQYLWLHKRFKTRPKGEKGVY
ncbi:MAG: LpxL/LpxP family Kdo(2)-lipid IV(A) lauroyl/palmitoleoyl acyltransferase [Gammaproteobacteria bacterium]|nr:LpxL/LpxP family Kdo(2)-lipid IV(A) lauroyl/palmitoleoyl acyltransferase [Gammaproteobacteria bacterium]MCW8971751.1 LpxL/LpxP family Kdo(2)-lipid IV(A) lauroyl/palmitoleoyl acyltransferase [Gammaproteobacteria bacterium]MCW8993344.1 LpxL/LpxP family Kdo(2)-lipid IV(A) lauroyl/palmitoleoyl acyltransferase [Gammaproteobacteria bacterium]